jgi:tetratricopeptide (TPR) repeat protein
VGHAVMARANLAGEALDRAASQLDRAQPGAVRLDLHAAAALELRFELTRDAEGATLLREDPRDLAPRNVLGQPTPTVGREREIAQLQELYGAMLGDSFPRAAVMIGTQGIGKSRIRSEIVQRLELAPVPPEVLMVRCDSVVGGTSVSALGKALRTTMGVQDGAEAREQVQLVKRFVRARLPRSLHFLAAFIGELVGVPFPDQNDEPLRAARANGPLMQSRIRMALEAFVRTQTGRIPQVVVLEDAHMADDTTFELLDWLLACPDIRFAAFAFARPELDTLEPNLWSQARVTRIELGPLPAAMAERIIGTVLPNSDAKTRATLIKRAAGNPLVLEELVRCTAEGKDELPLTVQAMIQRRLDRLPDPVRETVRAASVFGRYFWAGGVSVLLHREVDDDLLVAEKEEIILRQGEESSRVAGQMQWMFRQGLVRDAANASLLDEDRAALHLAVGEWLETVGSVDLGLIAYHVERGGDRGRAAGLYARAAQQALESVGQMDMALDLAQRGLDCAAHSSAAMGEEHTRLLMTKAHVLNRMGRLSESMEAAEQASKLAPEASSIWVEAQRVLSSSLIESGRGTEGDARLSWALGPQFASTMSSAMRSLLRSARVRGLINLNRPGQALSVSEQAVQEATAAGQDGERALLFALDARLFALMAACAPADAVEAGHRLIETADRAGDVHLASRGRINVASSLNYLGMYEDAQRLLDRALSDVRGFRLRLLEALCIHNVGMAHARLGNLDAGIEAQREAQRIADECGGVRVAHNTRIYEAMMLTWRGQPGDLRRAHELASYSLEATEQHPGLQVIALFAMAKVQFARRELDSGLQAAAEAHRRLGDGPVEEWDEHIRLVYVETLLAAGQQGNADEVLRTAFEAVRQRVAAVRRPDLQQAFVTRNYEVRQLLYLAQQRLGLTL